MGDFQHSFDETLLSGYLDKELTQGENQRVRIHLEDCAECTRTLQEIKRLRETTMTTGFNVRDDGQWSEAPRGAASRWLRNIGWIMTPVWVVALIGIVLWGMASETENLFSGLFWALFWALFWLIAILFFLSALIDRLEARKTDRYRRVEK